MKEVPTTALNSQISWCTDTLDITVGCSRVSAGCDHCYAEGPVDRAYGGGFFNEIRLFPERLRNLIKFAPTRGSDGLLAPKMIFVNNLSDFWHEKITDDFIHRALDEFERHPAVIFQILTKRPGRMQRFIKDRYGSCGAPTHFWLGVTAEDNRLAPALELLRQTKDQVGELTAFASVEPITAPADKLDFAGIDWVLTGGESGPKARPMQFDWLEDVHERILAAGIPLYFKQYGHARNPAARIWPDLTPAQALLKAVEQGLERAPRKNGGATYKGRIIQEKPAGYYRLKQSINNEEWNSHP